MISTTVGRINPKHVVQVSLANRPGVYGVDLYVTGQESAIFLKTETSENAITLLNEISAEIDESNSLKLEISTKIAEK